MFVRRFLSDPGDDVLLNIESVNILDLEPPSSIQGVGTGTAILVGEFENGPYNTPLQVASANDLMTTLGSLGYTRGSVPANDCCAVARKADSATIAEYWNGNGFVQLSGKTFAALVLVRVNTSIGEIQFSPLAYLTGASRFAYNLTGGLNVLGLDVGAGEVLSTFTGVAAARTSVGGTFPSTFAGGETLSVSYDGIVVNVTFLATDQSITQVIAKINLFAGWTMATNVGGQIQLNGRQLGTGGSAAVISGSAGVLAQLGMTAGSTAGTGNVANLAAVQFSEIATVVETAMGSGVVNVEQDSLNNLRISNLATPLTGTITVGPSTTATPLGFVIGATSSAAAGNAGIIPAGTVITNVGATLQYVTTMDVAVDGTGTAVNAPVRPRIDDGSQTGVGGAGLINTVLTPPDVGAFSAVNLTPIQGALTESAIDAAYSTAFDSTLDPNAVSAVGNMIWSARQSNEVRQLLRSNALKSSANGLYGRVACVRTPMNTPKALALSTVVEPGVGATRDQRVIYNYPNVSTFVPLIAQRGVAGGQGFTASGNVDVGSDGFLITIMSQLPPEENPGQTTSYTTNALGLESGPNAQGFQIGDYILFKKAGICAPLMDGGVLTYESGVTSVDPLVNPSLKNINRRRMADFIEDSIAPRAKAYGKKLARRAMRKSLLSEIRQFMVGLLSANNLAAQRINGFTVNDNAATLTAIQNGLYRITVKAQTIASLDSIVIAVTAGEQVQVDEILPQAA